MILRGTVRRKSILLLGWQGSRTSLLEVWLRAFDGAYLLAAYARYLLCRGRGSRVHSRTLAVGLQDHVCLVSRVRYSPKGARIDKAEGNLGEEEKHSG